jgi:2-haloacid dehalogenase
MDASQFTHLTFDCYGTLIDWEAGILGALTPLLVGSGAELSDQEIVRRYARFEAEEEAGAYRPYREILSTVAGRIADSAGARLSAAECEALPASVGSWPAFADTADELRRLRARFRLAILSNIDDALFARSLPSLGVSFNEVITAEQVRSYKPGRAHFEEALRRLAVPKEQILHVAQSLNHDHVPAKEMGFATAWVNRPSRLPGQGLSLPADVRPDMETPDLRTLVDRLMPGSAIASHLTEP